MPKRKMNLLKRWPHLHSGRTELFRNELKYLCSEGELELIASAIRPLCALDSHTTGSGTYAIRSLYFDDSENSCYYDNENGTDPREKFRIRIYNASDQQITLECKKKQRYMTHKDSCSLTKEQYQMILQGQLMPTSSDAPLLRKFYAQCQQRCLRPKVIVAYERTPFVYPAGNVRITFDRNIGCSTDIDGFFAQRLPLRPILPLGKQILEVKYDEFLPDFLYTVMDLGSLRQTAFSKYYLCRKFST